MEPCEMKKGGSCLLVLVVAALAVVAIRLVIIEKERDGDRRKAQVDSTEKTAYELLRENIDEVLRSEQPGLGANPVKELTDGDISTIKKVRDNVVKRRIFIKMKLKKAEQSYERLVNERSQLERRIAELSEEYNKYPDDDNVCDELAQSDEDLEDIKRDILREKANVNLLRDYDYRMEREVAALSSAVRKCEADGRVTAAAVVYDALKKDLDEAHGAFVAAEQLRRTLDKDITEVSVGVSGEKTRKRTRLQKYRKANTGNGGQE